MSSARYAVRSVSIHQMFLESLDSRAAILEKACVTDEKSADELLFFIAKLPAEYWAIETRATVLWQREGFLQGEVRLSLN